MAFLKRRTVNGKKTGNFTIQFRFRGDIRKFTLGHDDEILAQESLGKLKRLLRDQNEGIKPLAADATHEEIVEFFKTNGERTKKITAAAKPLTLKELFDIYPEKLTRNAKSKSSLDLNLLHGRHLKRILGEDRNLSQLSDPGILQGYVNERISEKKRNSERFIDSITAKKEIDTLRTVWRWAIANGYTTVPCPTAKIEYSKPVENEPFQTWQQITRRIENGKLNEEQQKDLWEALYLNRDEVEEVLDFVQANAKCPWIYLGILFVAHTGARRREMIRSEIEDFEFDVNRLRVRDMKKDKTKQMVFRYVEISPRLRNAFLPIYQKYTSGDYSNGRFTIPVKPKLATTIPAGLEASERYCDRVKSDSWEQFKAVFKGSKWQVLHGYHTFRHSFISNSARAGVSQQSIDSWVGHETDEQRKRYRHLFPEVSAAEFKKLYG